MKLTSILKRKKPIYLGIGISSSSVKVLELSEQDLRFRVESYAVEPLPPNSVVEKTIADVESVGEAIRRAVRKSGTKLRDAVVAIGSSSVIAKTISMPSSLNDDELAAQIELEANLHIPYPIEEVSIDFEVVGQSDIKPDTVDVLLVACRNENVDALVAALELGGVGTSIVDVESYALENALMLVSSLLPNNGFDRTIAVADIGATMTTLYVVRDQQLIYTREQVFGGRQLTEEIQRRYGLSYEEAGRAKREGNLPESYQTEVLDPFKEAVVQQIVRSLQFFFSSSRISKIDHVLIAGGCASITGLDEAVQEHLGVSSSIANPFAAMSISPKVNSQQLSEDAPSLLVECGLALRSFD